MFVLVEDEPLCLLEEVSEATGLDQPVGGSKMSRPACVILLVVLWSGPYLLIHNASGSAVTLGQPEQQLPQAQFGGIYRRMIGDNPSTLDPTFLIDAYERAVVSQVFDGLVQLDVELNPIPAIAEFWESSEDGRTWTFNLRRGVKFHHGREVTAQDFVYSFSRFLKSQKSVPMTEFFRRVREQRAGELSPRQPTRPGLDCAAGIPGVGAACGTVNRHRRQKGDKSGGFCPATGL